MEVLLAVFILGIGLIMVATIFPVGADWTRQSTEDSVAQTVAQNALSIIRDDYAPSSLSLCAGTLSNLPTPASGAASPLQALPNFTSIPIAERCYQFGNNTPFPAPAPASCNYFWTALARVQPGQIASASRRYDIYILVFRKGAADQTFPAGSVTGVSDQTYEPTLILTSGSPIIPIGAIGIGQSSGTVFREGTLINYAASGGATPTTVGRPAPMTNENAIYGSPANGGTVSPLIYVYQTTISF